MGINKDGLKAPDYRALADFRFALRKFLNFSEVAAREVGVLPQQYQALLAIKARDGDSAMSVGLLAERLFIRHHSAVGLIHRLASAGLVIRRVDAGDRRKIGVKLTPKAEAILARLASIHHEELRRSAPMLRALLKNLIAMG